MLLNAFLARLHFLGQSYAIFSELSGRVVAIAGRCVSSEIRRVLIMVKTRLSIRIGRMHLAKPGTAAPASLKLGVKCSSGPTGAWSLVPGLLWGRYRSVLV